MKPITRMTWVRAIFLVFCIASNVAAQKIITSLDFLQTKMDTLVYDTGTCDVFFAGEHTPRPIGVRFEPDPSRVPFKMIAVLTWIIPGDHTMSFHLDSAASRPGFKIADIPFRVFEPETFLPWQIIDVSSLPELNGLSGPFWVVIDAFCTDICKSSTRDLPTTGRSYNYSAGEDVWYPDPYASYAIRAVIAYSRESSIEQTTWGCIKSKRKEGSHHE